MWATLRAAMASLLALLCGFGLMQMGNMLRGTLLSVRGAHEAPRPDRACAPMARSTGPFLR
jgi:hypothetical protein